MTSLFVRQRRFCVGLLAICSTVLLACGDDVQSGAASADSAATIGSAESAAPHDAVASLAYLIASAGRDFKAHTAGPVEVRSVRYGLRDTTGGVQSHVLCGEYRRVTATDTTPWTEFSTVETSRYEQWLGETRYCQIIAGVWNKDDSVTVRLQKAIQ